MSRQNEKNYDKPFRTEGRRRRNLINNLRREYKKIPDKIKKLEKSVKKAKNNGQKKTLWKQIKNLENRKFEIPSIVSSFGCRM